MNVLSVSKVSQKPLSGQLGQGSSATMNVGCCVIPLTTDDAGYNAGGRRSLETWASNYSIPWHQGNPAFRSALEKQKRPMKTDLLHFIPKVSEDISERFGDSPGAANLTVIAAAMV
jgi:hypothetical protein